SLDVPPGRALGEGTVVPESGQPFAVAYLHLRQEERIAGFLCVQQAALGVLQAGLGVLLGEGVFFVRSLRQFGEGEGFGGEQFVHGTQPLQRPDRGTARAALPRAGRQAPRRAAVWTRGRGTYRGGPPAR